jgi:UDP-glucose 4-epimerase
MTISLVTGGAGFIGSHVADHLLKMGHTVIVLDDLSGGNLDNLTVGTLLDRDLMSIGVNPTGEGAIVVVGSILDTHCIDNLFSIYRPDCVFHLAAYAAEGLSHFIRRYNYEMNVIGSVNLINAAVNYGVKRFVFTSSIAAYGMMGDDLADEDSWPAPVDPYGIAKYAVEMDLQVAHDLFGLDYTIFRPHNVYGERQNLNDPYRNVIGIFMRQCLQGQPMTIFGDGYQSRGFTYIDDVAPYIASCVTNEGARNRVFNIGSSETRTVWGLAKDVAKALGVEFKTVKLPARQEVRWAAASHVQFDRVFGKHKTITMTDGIARMAAWAKTQTLREPKPFAAIEIDKNLPDIWRKLHEH